MIKEPKNSELHPAKAELVFRVFLSLIFLVAAINHMLVPGKVIARLNAAPLAWLCTTWMPAALAVHLAGLAMIVGGAMLLTGTRTRLAAVMLMVVLVPITITVQAGAVSHLGPLFKNIAIFGGLIHFAANGSSAFSVDGWWQERRQLVNAVPATEG